MTQLMLFEATSNTNPSVSMAGAAIEYARTVNFSRSPETPQAGVNRMGDLARLVLMRYELLARRRAEIAARHAS